MRDPMSAFDKIISDAQQEGKFDDLPGKGQPLVIDTSPDAALKGVLKEANVSMAPEWITLALEIDRLMDEGERAQAAFAAALAAGQAALAEEKDDAARREAPPDSPLRRGWRLLTRGEAAGRAARPADPAETAAALQRRWDRELEQQAARLHSLSGKIRRLNLIVPFSYRQRPLLAVGEQLEAFADRFPRPERAPDGAWQFGRGVVPAALLAPPREETRLGRKRDTLEAAVMLRQQRQGRRPPPIG